MHLKTGRIGLGAYLHCINRRVSARCGCELGNQIESHVLLEYLLHKDEREITVSDMNTLMYNHDADPAALRRVLQVPALAEVWREEFQSRLET